jgi:nitroreductase
MDVAQAIRSRYSCRQYADKPIDKDTLRKILDAARQAPSAKNLQDWRFVVVTGKETKHKLAVAANSQTFIQNAGAIIIGCTVCQDTMRCGQTIGPIDLAIAMEHICLQATELGLATCWIGSFYPDQVRPIVGIPENITIVQLMALGYPADEPREHTRGPLEGVVSFERWAF